MPLCKRSRGLHSANRFCNRTIMRQPARWVAKSDIGCETLPCALCVTSLIGWGFAMALVAMDFPSNDSRNVKGGSLAGSHINGKSIWLLGRFKMDPICPWPPSSRGTSSMDTGFKLVLDCDLNGLRCEITQAPKAPRPCVTPPSFETSKRNITVADFPSALAASGYSGSDFIRHQLGFLIRVRGLHHAAPDDRIGFEAGLGIRFAARLRRSYLTVTRRWYRVANF